ncbi:MAG: hypothetical protein Q8M01_08265, partial [Rubrivivax sp.]|nr:hypothetical protein [Rubrivivax sp.]
MIRRRLFLALLPWWLAAASAPAHAADAPGPVGGAPAALPTLQIPAVEDLRPLVPRPVKAASALLGLGRQRLALVLGLGTVGDRLVVDPAPRDVQAVAGALRAGGFVVMLREDVSGAELRAALAELRSRLQPGGVGFVYVAALGAQLDGVNWLLPRDMPLAGAPDAQTLAQQLRGHGVPVAEVVDALMGPPGSPRLLVVDAAYRHPALAVLPQPGLAEQKLPPGVMALFGHGLNAVQEVPAVAPLPSPAPADLREIAASRFARVLVGSITTPRISGPQALLSTRRVLFDASQGQDKLWLAGETDDSEELAEATLLDGLIPRTPEEYARQGVRLVGERLTRASGEQTVAEVLAQPAATPSGAEATPGVDGKPRVPPETVRPAAAGAPAAGGMGQALATAAGAVGTMAGVAATAATVAAGATAAQAATAVAGMAG